MNNILPVKPTIIFSDLEKIDIRVGRIEKVEDVPASDKLVRLTVNFGNFIRNILVGLKKEREHPEEITGKQALFVVNLAPKAMAGEQSEGMMFDIGYANHIIPVLAVPETEVPDGVSAG
ncbi:tRNA-binding protein [Candidatus Woesebacteria bacterium]|jgi:methionine--tRNA ligase beta chain|nr:tRNA-binding protein [Candidatus Woesebacteria bacterium]